MYIGPKPSELRARYRVDTNRRGRNNRRTIESNEEDNDENFENREGNEENINGNRGRARTERNRRNRSNRNRGRGRGSVNRTAEQRPIYRRRRQGFGQGYVAVYENPIKAQLGPNKDPNYERHGEIYSRELFEDVSDGENSILWT